MTRTRKAFISVLAAGAMTMAITASAVAADYSSVNALVGDQSSVAAEPSGYSSPNAIVGDDAAVGSPTDHSSVTAIMGDRKPSQGGPVSTVASDSPSSLNSIVGPDDVTSASPLSPPSASSSDGFDWGDALLGAAITLGLALTIALLLGTTQRRTRVEPSI